MAIAVKNYNFEGGGVLWKCGECGWINTIGLCTSCFKEKTDKPRIYLDKEDNGDPYAGRVVFIREDGEVAAQSASFTSKTLDRYDVHVRRTVQLNGVTPDASPLVYFLPLWEKSLWNQNHV